MTDNTPTHRPNPLMFQTLTLALSEANQHTRCYIGAAQELTSIGSAAKVEFGWWQRLHRADVSYGEVVAQIPLTNFVSRAEGPETFELARETADDAAAWLIARGWQPDGTERIDPESVLEFARNDVGVLYPEEETAILADSLMLYTVTLRRDAPVPFVPALTREQENTAAQRLQPYQDALRGERSCLIAHEYSYETRGGLAIADEVAFRWGKQARMLRSVNSDDMTAMERLFPEGEMLTAQTVAYLVANGWTLEKRDRQVHGMATLSNDAATNITVTFYLNRKKRFGLF